MFLYATCVKRIGLALTLFVFGHLAGAAANSLEEVYVNKTGATEDRAIIMRASGETYLIEKGSGCYSLWRYRGSLVVIASPGPFLGLGSKLVLPETNQRCNIWNVVRRGLKDDDRSSHIEMEFD